MIKKRETKSKISTMSLRPSTHEALQKLAYLNDTSVNHMCSIILEKYIREHQDEVASYDMDGGEI